MRVCVVYDCLFPYTIGGAERWYRNLAERLAAEGHEVTYLTLRQWPRRERLRREGLRGAVTVLRGLYAGPSISHTPGPADDLVLFAGRLIPEKRVTLGVAAVAQAVRRVPQLRAEFLGDGPEREALRQAI